MLDVATVTLASGLALSYKDQGDRSGPVLALLPGPTDSWRSYSTVLDRMPPSIRTIAVSQRGHGDSDKPPSGYRIDDFADDVVALLDELGIERAVLAGHSASCFTSRRVAIDRPQRVTGLVLEASPMTLQGDADLERFVASVSELHDPIDPEFARSFVADTSSGAVQPQVLNELVHETLKVPARVWREMFAAMLQYDDLSELPRIAVPTLLVWGDADGLVTREMQEQLAAALPSAELIVYPGAGHTPRWEEPVRFASDLVAFVERCP